MNEDKEDGDIGPIERYVRGEYAGFGDMRREVDNWRDKIDPKEIECIFALLYLAETTYFMGVPPLALYFTWTAGQIFGCLASRPAAARILRRKRKEPPASRKAKVEAAWKQAFNAHKHFHGWGARDQAEYLMAKHSADVAGIASDTLGKYIRKDDRNV